MLQQPDIVDYLLSLDIVKPRAVVCDELAILDVSSRNGVFVVTTRGGDALVVKQAGPHSAATLAHEAAVLVALGDDPSLRDAIPAVVHHDPDAARLVLRTPDGARNWKKATRAGARHALAPARRLGRLLAAVHAVAPDRVEPPPDGTTAMWGLRVPEPELEFVLNLSRGSRELVGLLQRNGPLCERLRELAAPPTRQTLVHGDLRWENCLRTGVNGARRRDRVLLIDWELAGPGDPAFDVGTVLAEHLANWIESIPVLDGNDVGRFAEFAGRPLARDVLGAFWDAYRGAAAEAPPLHRVAELTGLRLLQSAVERTQDAYEATTPARLLATVGERLLAAPELGAMMLLGLRE
jgi:aminoglycoside phosphotransferase (APT) family kinase protein